MSATLPKSIPLSPQSRVSSHDSAVYIGDMLTGLKKLATGRELMLLSHLLDLALTESRLLAKEPQAQDTRFPG